MKFLAALFLTSSLFTGGVSSGCRWHSQMAKSMSSGEDIYSSELKTLAEGSISPVTTPFVAVIRDGDTYAALREVATNLPALTSEFFKTNLVIAAFLGERNTGGYSVAISRDATGQIRISEKAPRKELYVTQMITTPFKVISLATTGAPAIQVSLDERFKQTSQLYRINNGTFTISGGFAGRRDTYQLAGKIQVLRLRNLVSFGFAIVGSGTTHERGLRDFATGSLRDDGIVISRLAHGSLLDPPSGDFHANGKFGEKNTLTVELDSGPVTVPDGYSGKGSIEAEMVAASAN
jgi:PrcB C-terminal